MLAVAVIATLAGSAAGDGRPEPQPEPESDTPALLASAIDTTDVCPWMPTVGLAPRTTRRPLDLDSIRKLPEAVVDSLVAENALPRTDGEVIRLYRNDRVYRMPTVRLDSAGYPIRVAPLCRRTGRSP